MNDNRTKEQLIQELEDLRRRMAELEKSETERKRVDTELGKAYLQLRAVEEQMPAGYDSLAESERSLSESEERFKTLFERSTDAQILLDLEGKVVDCNDAHIELFGLQGKAEVLGHSPADFAPAFQLNGTSSSGMGNKIRTTILEKGSARFEWIHQKHDPARTLILTELSCTLIPIANRPVIHVAIRDITERKRAEEALKQSEERYRTAIEQSNDGVALVKGDRHIFVNQKMVEIFGYDRPEEIIGQPINLIVHPDDQEKVNGINRRRQKGEAVLRKYEFKGNRKNGEPIYIEISASNTTYQGEAVSLVYLRDISERKLTEDALRESEKKYRALTDFMPISIFEVDSEFGLTSFNRTALETFRYKEEDYQENMNVLQFFPPEERQRVGENMVKVMQGTSIPGQEYSFLRKDGSTFIGLIYASPNIHLNKFVGIRGAILDITERKRTEEALRESEERYRTIIETMEEAYYEVDLAGNLTFFNDNLCRIVKLSREELIGLNNLQYSDTENAKKIYQAFNTVYRTGKPAREIEFEILRRDGAKRYVETSASLIYDSSGNPVGYRGIVRDITERRQAEEERRNLEERLQRAEKMEALGTLAGRRRSRSE